MLRVYLMCSTLESQGPTNVIFNMLKAYYESESSSIEFSILTLSKEKENSKYKLFESLGVNIHCFNFEGAINTLSHVKVVEEYINEKVPDICHSYGLRADVVLSYLNLNSTIKISSLWNNPFDDYLMFGFMKGKMLARYHMKRYKQFDAIVTCSKHNNLAIKPYGIKSSIIYTGVPSDYFKPLSEKDKLLRREMLNIPLGVKVFIFIANLIERKNPISLIKAFINAKTSNSLLFIMGDGVLMNECMSIANGNPNIRFLGHQKTTLNYLQISDYYISPSTSEGFPTAVLEAMSVGVEPLLSSITPHKEMMSKVQNAVFFSERNIEEISNVIRTAEKRDLTIDFRKYVLENYTNYIMLDRYKQLYGLALGRNIK